MRQDMKSETQTKNVLTALWHLTNTLHQTGAKDLPMQAAAVAMFLKLNPSLITHPLGRHLLRIAKEGIKGTVWEKAVYPDPKTDESRERDRIFKKRAEEMGLPPDKKDPWDK